MSLSTKKEGKYDAACEEVLDKLKAKAVLLIVADGYAGNGFSACFTDPRLATGVPDVLRQVAGAIEADGKLEDYERGTGHGE